MPDVLGQQEREKKRKDEIRRKREEEKGLANLWTATLGCDNATSTAESLD
jgi:hypothetical protein